MMVRYTAISLLALAISHSDAKIHEVNAQRTGRRNQEDTGGRRNGGRRRHGARNGGAFGGKLNGLMGSLPVNSEAVQQLAEEHGDAAVQNVLYLLEGGLATPRASLDLAISTWKDNLEASNQDCSSQQVDLPACSWNLRGEPGTWVCRTLYNPMTGVRESRNTCVHPAFSYSTIDTCGACAADEPPVEGETPPSAIATCTCSCTSARGEAGIGITVLGGALELCYPESMSNTAVNTFDFVSCAECAV